MAKVQDGVNNETITYTYDLADRLVQIQNSNLFKTKYTYDNNSNVNSRKYLLNELEETINYKYDRDNRINYLSLSNAKDLFYHYDRLSRIVKKELRSGENTYITEYEYENTDTSNRTTTSIETVKNGTEELNYTYDAKGNIETISEGEVQTHKYYYDSLDQLIREDNKKLNKTITYTYDTGGNLLNKKEYAYTESNLGEETGTINYSYENTNWKDQLTSYNGKAIIYDNIGNPLTYDGNTYTWQNGRQLAGISNTAKEQTITYKYNDEGIRTEKVVNGIASKYYLEGTKVIYEMTGTNLSYYQYDEQGNIIGMQYNGTQYYYIKNLQGDIIGILDNELNQVVKYDYDSWGKVIAITDATGTEITDQSHIGNINPYRYRSYRYDRETGLYYLQSRYYNPEWGRFLNADGYITGIAIGNNLYAYCCNNPINYYDPYGEIAVTSSMLLLLLGIAMGAYMLSQVDVDLSWIDFSTPSSSKSSATNDETVASEIVIAGIAGAGGIDGQEDVEFNSRLNSKTYSNKGYKSFYQVKKAIGSPGQGREWHHIVEQSQIKKSGFDVQMIQNPKNLISIDKGIHRKISGYYNSIDIRLKSGIKVRDWLAGQSYEAQYEFGIKVLKMFGGI